MCMYPDYSYPKLLVTYDSKRCATAKWLSVAQSLLVRHVYLAVAHDLSNVSRVLGLPISIFLLVIVNSQWIPYIEH